MTLQMGTNQPRRAAVNTPRQPPDPVSYRLIAEKRNNRLEALTIFARTMSRRRCRSLALRRRPSYSSGLEA
jgi:hypothetical protein